MTAAAASRGAAVPRGRPRASDWGGAVVVDASAVVALLIDPGERGEAVAAWLRGRHVHAPAHLPVEVANVLRRQRNARRLSRAEADLAFADLLKVRLRLWPFEAVAERAWQLGGAVSAYDAAYAALAEMLGAPLVTLDARLAAAPGPTCAFAVV